MAKTIDHLSAAKNAATAPVAKTKKPKEEAPRVQMGSSLQVVAAAKALQDHLKTVQERHMSMVKQEAAGIFTDNGIATGERPDTFKAEHGLGQATVVMKTRQVSSPLEAEEVKSLREAGIEVREEVVTPEAYTINPEFLSDPGLRALLIKALGSVTYPEGKDPLIYKPAVTKHVASEEAVTQLFQVFKGSKAKVATASLLDKLTTVAVTASWKGTKPEAYAILAPELAQDQAK